ncbi:ferritin-like fold-containing protein [Rathayibacter sp. YIM 133350]|uniref:ferritin-like fold-containing protein n=1 Tax=Rathayibacter sp. YIM 133350 TaxID=3131992 RepID=UPI00307FAB10
MAQWTDLTRRRPDFSRLRSRSGAPRTRVEFAELTPDTLPFLGQAAYIQLEFFENLARAVSLAPTLAAKEDVSVAARAVLRKHHKLIAQIRALGHSPDDVMAPFAPAIDAFRVATGGADWYELLLTGHITAGMLDDFFVTLSSALPGDVGARAASILSRKPETDAVAALLRDAITADPALGSRLAMWGRRLVGDTLLVARSALRDSNAHGASAERIEPVFTELIAAHTRRMDALGLTA